MYITKQQILDDIQSGKCTVIYYSAQTLWWTHLEEDVKEATLKGKEKQKEDGHKMLADDKIPEPQKRMIKSHMQGIDDSRVPLDTSGSPLKMVDKPIVWMEEAEKNPNHYGEHKLNAFMKAHHQNLDGWCPTSWNQVNKYLDHVKDIQVFESKDEEE